MRTPRTSRSSQIRCLRSAGRVVCLVVALAGVVAWTAPGYAERPTKAQSAKKRTLDSKRIDGGRVIGTRSDSLATPSLSAKARTGPRPIITAEEPVHDFGEMWIGPILKHTFKITNTGEMELKITKVKPSCGCTIAGTYPRALKPGETGEFPFSVSSRKLRGKFAKSVNISSNDPATPTLRLQLRGKVKRYVDLSPTTVQLGKLYGKEPQERVIKLTNNTEKALELVMGTKPDGNFKFELVTNDPGREFELHVTALPPYAPTGVFKKKITLSTNLTENPTINIDMRGTVPPRLDIKPSAITIRATTAAAKTAGRPSTRVVRLTNYGATPVKVISASVDDPKLDVTVKEQKVGEAYNVQVKFPAGYELPDGGRLLTLKTDDQNRPTINVPIRAVGGRTAGKQRPAESLVGKRSPRFNLKTLDGKPLNPARIKGSVTVLDFFAVNCGFCKRQVPRLEKVRATYAEKGVRFVAVSQTMRGKRYTDEEVKAKIEELGFKGELALDPNNDVGPLFKATSFPTMVVIGKTGKVDAVNVGNIGDLETRLPGQLDALLAGKPIPGKFLAKKSGATPPKTARKRPDDLIGKPAPAFATTTFDGKKVGNKEFANSAATVLDFVAGNCGFCKKQIPRLETLREKYTAKGVRFVNVFETMRTPWTKEQILDKMKALGAHMEVAHDPSNAIGPKYNATGFPTMILVGKTGKVEAVNVGNVGDLETRVAKQLDAIIAGKPVPRLAKAAPSKPNKPRGGQIGDLIGKPAPAFAVKTIDGKDVSNAEFAKHPATVLDFFAYNCGYCKKQIPRVEKMRQKYADKGVRFVNVCQKMRTAFPEDKVVEKMNELGFKGELAMDMTNKIGGLFSARGFPTMVVVGRSGKVEAVNVGNLGDLEKRMDAQLTALIEGKAIPKFAGTAPPKKSNRRPAEDLAGKPAPAFAVTTLKGNSFSNADFAKHKATVLDFVAPNCGFCKRQIPGVEKIRAEYEAKGVRFLAVVQKMRKDFTEDEIVGIFKKAGSNLELSTSDFAQNKIGKAYKAVSFPTLFVVDSKGKIAKVVVGAKQDLEKQVKAQLDILIKG